MIEKSSMSYQACQFNDCKNMHDMYESTENVKECIAATPTAATLYTASSLGTFLPHRHAKLAIRSSKHASRRMSYIYAVLISDRSTSRSCVMVVRSLLFFISVLKMNVHHYGTLVTMRIRYIHRPYSVRFQHLEINTGVLNMHA